MKGHRKLYELARTGQETVLYVTYNQPAKDRIAFLIYQVYWRMWFKIPPLRPVARMIDRLSLIWHRRSCNNNCGKVRVRDVTRHFGGGAFVPSSGRWIVTCTYLGWDIGTDEKIYRLDTKNNTEVRYPFEQKEESSKDQQSRAPIEQKGAPNVGAENADGKGAP